MTNTELVKTVSSATGLTIKQSQQVAQTVFGIITTAIADGDSVSISKFGTFKVKSVGARKMRNPKTGEPVEVPASKKVVFQPASLLKSAANNGPVTDC